MLLDSLSVLLPGQGTQSRDRRSVVDEGFRARFARVVAAVVGWAI
ncbi:hypothetical protein [Halolamina salina]|uniref:Uncharacterized protein n=1 Tax=Halolamina salina TaxID=1220023 RepID=A0ABD6B338_9EURY